MLLTSGAGPDETLLLLPEPDEQLAKVTAGPIMNREHASL